ncbi:hypothetical protein JTE90_029179 [Oedothorax gibbosus]|uniref:BTB domain-containing protein n=1 Tax=Oedothorax gibbosus TaxID=931172 RepID=A0AAV6VFP5_9ARAC|nr:hypothetical protein JTE90_029179 [Oedothorax gibbosus]
MFDVDIGLLEGETERTSVSSLKAISAEVKSGSNTGSTYIYLCRNSTFYVHLALKRVGRFCAGFLKMSVKESNYLLSCEDDENNLVKFLTTMTDYFWQKYDFENLRDPEDLNKVLFRMALKVSHSGDEILWKFTWEKIQLFHLEEYVLTEANYAVAVSTVINCEEHRPSILRTAKLHLDNLDYRRMLTCVAFTAIKSHGSSSDVRYQWIWKRIEEATAEIKVLLEQNYFFIKTVMDLSDANLLKRALQTAMVYLDKEQMHHVYKEAYLHAVKWHGAFVNEKIWNATLSLQTLKKVSCRHQWDNLFEHLDGYKCVKETKRSLDLPLENVNDSNKKTRLADEKS